MTVFGGTVVQLLMRLAIDGQKRSMSTGTSAATTRPLSIVEQLARVKTNAPKLSRAQKAELAENRELIQEKFRQGVTLFELADAMNVHPQSLFDCLLNVFQPRPHLRREIMEGKLTIEGFLSA